MEVEFEATYPNVDPKVVKEKLIDLGARLERERFIRKSAIFNLPEGHGIKGGWLRVRNDGQKNTMSLKVVDGEGISRQKEIEFTISDFESAVLLLQNVGCEKKADQESWREIWKLDGVEITIDEWPFLEPFVEVEGKTEQEVREVSEKLGFDYSAALFDSVDAQYSKKYNITIDAVNQRTPIIVFDMGNPFLNRND